MQIDFLYDEDCLLEDISYFNFLKEGEMTSKLIKINTNTFKINKLNFFEEHIPNRSEDILNLIIKKIEGKHNIFYEEVYKFKNNSSICYTYITGLDRFHLVRYGKHVKPQRLL